MARLFVAADLPPDTAMALARIQPPPAPGVRLAEPSQMHLTLHFVGEADPDRTAAALAGLAVPAFSLAVEGVGQFRSADGAVYLWAAVRHSPELLRLHAAVASALTQERFKLEARPYTPHITLARCEPDGDAEVAERFLAEQARFALAAVGVTTVGLYASTRAGDAPRYELVRSFELSAG